MIEIALFIALIGSFLAGLWDLKTTEVPDEIPFLMIVLSIALWFVNGVISNDFTPLFYSVTIGTIVLIIGLIMYHKNQWGEADAWILASIFYAMPAYKDLFIIDYLPNLLIVSTIYLIIYSIVLGILNRNVLNIFVKDLSNNKYLISFIISCIIVFSLVLYILSPYQKPLLLYRFALFMIFFVIFWRYAKVIENNLFKKKISTKNLRVGDVLVSTKWVGLTEEDVKKLQKTNKTVVIKEGVRFVPVFFLALLATLLYGNLLLSIIF